MLWRKNAAPLIPEDKLYPFDLDIMRLIDSMDFSVFETIAVMYAVILLVSVVLRGVHFIDLFLSVVPLVLVIYKHAIEELGPHHEIILVSAMICTVTHLCLTVGGREGHVSQKLS